MVRGQRPFSLLRGARRVWAIGSVHSDAVRLERLHKVLLARLEPGDRIVYLGNMIGRGPAVIETLDALLSFRCLLLARPRAFTCDIAYLRGSQEEMWQKLLQLQFATDPKAVLNWMLDHGLGSTLEAYGGNTAARLRDGIPGPVMLTRWTSGLREAMRAHPGHYEWLSELRRAAYTDDGALLFVNAGLDPSRPLEAQSDSLWWGTGAFARVTEPYGSFCRVVRGFDPDHPGLSEARFTLTVDGGCGFGGPLLAACLVASGEVVDLLEA